MILWSIPGKPTNSTPNNKPEEVYATALNCEEIFAQPSDPCVHDFCTAPQPTHSLAAIFADAGYSHGQHLELLTLLTLAHFHPPYPSHTRHTNFLKEPEWQCLYQKKTPLALEPSIAEKILNMPRFSSIEEGRIQLNIYEQSQFLRPKGVEREMTNVPAFYLQYKEPIQLLFSNLHFFKAREPKYDSYDATLILGSTEDAIKHNALFLRNLLEEKATLQDTGMIFLLGSDRPLWPIKEPITAVLLAHTIAAQSKDTIPASVLAQNIQHHFQDIFTADVQKRMDPKEITALRNQLIQYYERHYKVEWPTEAEMMKEVMRPFFPDTELIIVTARKKPFQTRATTDDTYEAFHSLVAEYNFFNDLETKPSLLIVSRQPHVAYQYYAAYPSLAKDYQLDITGPAADFSTPIPVFFDSLARATYGFTRCIAQFSLKQCEYRFH